MTREVLADLIRGEERTLMLEDGVPAELRVSREREGARAGSIVKGRVTQVVKGMQSAFVDIGEEKNGFLYEDDALAAAKSKKGRVLQGAEILVQVVREGVGDKGPRVTMKLSIPGRTLVLLPTESGIGVSKQIEGEARDRLFALVNEIKPLSAGVIVRTKAASSSEESLRLELRALIRAWEGVAALALSSNAPSVVYADDGLIARAVRDAPSGTLISCGSKEALDAAQTAKDRFASPAELRLLPGSGGAMLARGYREKCKRLLDRRVWLDSGGFIVVDQTEAMTVIDVNSGKFTGKSNLEETILQINLDAAREVARQLRFRDIGGIVIVDFIDMLGENARAEVVRELEKLLARDTTPTAVLGFTRLGLLEMTRKKTHGDTLSQLKETCPICGGDGRVWSDETIARFGLEDMDVALAASDARVELRAHPRVSSIASALGIDPRACVKADHTVPRDEPTVRSLPGIKKDQDPEREKR